MRVLTMLALAITVAGALLVHYCEGNGLRSLAVADEEDEIRPHRARLYHDYGVVHRVLRDEDLFDDYGHMRFGRSGPED